MRQNFVREIFPVETLVFIKRGVLRVPSEMRHWTPEAFRTFNCPKCNRECRNERNLFLHQKVNRSHIVRYQRLRTKDWRKPPNTVIVDRTSRWGNPYKMQDCDCNLWPKGHSHSREEALRLYHQYALKKLEAEPSWVDPLIGRNVACFCAPEEKCHGDILKELANR